MIWAQLGNILLEREVHAGERRQAFEFEELRVIEGPPRLQWMGSGLQEHVLELLLHRRLGDPSGRLAQLQAAAEAHEALPLVLGSGRVLGDFVITELTETSRHTDDDGTPEVVELRLSLKQLVPADPLLVVQLRQKAAAKKAQAEAPREVEQTVWDHFGDEEMAELAGGQSVMPEESGDDPESAWAAIGDAWAQAFSE